MINFKQIEKKWQDKWEKSKIFQVKEGKKKKYYVLDMFPYPSGEGLHMGHAFVFSLGDIFARFKRMQGFNVLYPIGYDALGLPAENAAIKAGTHPEDYTKKSMANFMKQQKAMGWSYDWARLVNTSDSKFYKWDQWIFLKMLEKGIAYRKKAPVNFCKKCDTVLANEQVINGKCWRHEDTNVEIKHLEQWFFKITNYTEELLKGLEKIDWPENAKKLQRNWIGKSFGTEINFVVEGKKEIKVENVEYFRKNININSKLKIKNKEFNIKQIVKFKFDDGSYYMKLFLDNGYVLADDLGGNLFILVNEIKNDLKIKEDKIDFNNKKFDFSYTAHAVAEETYGQEVFKKGEGETFWDYVSKDKSYLSLGIIDKTKERLDFLGEIIYSDDIQIIKGNEKWPIFTTRSDTIYGVTFMVISAQHPKLFDLVTDDKKKEVENFLKKIKSVSEKEMEDLEKEGVFTGSYAINPINNKKIPVYVGNFVLADYGSGMVMAVPAHDQRDFEFAKKYKIEIKEVIKGGDIKQRAYTDEGVMINSGKFDGMNSNKAKEEITKFLQKNKLGKKDIQFKLRDWLISRQRYWGTPIPIIYCEKCGTIPVLEKDLPIQLPKKVKFGKGNPLLTNEKWIKIKCPKCNAIARRETDTMDTFANSSWYYLRYTDSRNDKKIFDEKKANYWCPIDQYIGGPEHITMHLIYIRFYTKFLRDLGLLKFDEPALKYFTQGIIKGSDGEKMSKSRGNVIEPLEMINKFGADSLRLYLVSNSSPNSDFSWDDKAIKSSFKFVNKVYMYFSKFKEGKADKTLESRLNKTIKEVTKDVEEFKHNLSVIKIRDLFNKITDATIDKKTAEAFLKILHIYCPFITEELWEKLGNKSFVSLASWPVADEKKTDKKLEQAEQLIDKTVSDIMNILKIIKDRKQKGNKVYVYVMPFEKQYFDDKKLSERTGKEVKVFIVNDKSKYDPKGISKKSKPGKPGIYVE